MKGDLGDYLTALKTLFPKSVLKRWVFIFFIIPFLITIALFWRSFQINLFPKEEIALVATVEAPLSLPDKVIRLWLGGPIGPTGAWVCILNKNIVIVNHIKVASPYDQDPEAGAMELWVNLTNGDKHRVVYVPIDNFKCGDFSMADAQIASSTILYRLPGVVPIGLATDGKLFAQGKIDPAQSLYFVFPLPQDFLFSLLKVIIAWWFLVFAVLESLKISSTKYFQPSE